MKKCFIIMPFSGAKVADNELGPDDLSVIYKDYIKKAVEEYEVNGEHYFLEVRRFEKSVGSIIKGIVQDLLEADLVIADLTGVNPNVMYELGVRHALKRGTIMLTQDFSNFPSDLRDYLTVRYDFTNRQTDYDSNYGKLKSDLHMAITQVLETKTEDSPVLEYLRHESEYQSQTEVKNLKESSVIFSLMMESYDELAKGVSQEVLGDVEEYKTHSIWMEMFSVHLFSFIAKFRLLKLPVVSAIMFEDIQLGLILCDDIQKTFVTNEYFDTISGAFAQDENNPFATTFSDKIKKGYVNPFKLTWKSRLEKFTILEIFSKDENCENSLYENVLADIEEYLESEAIRLGIEREIEELLRT